jgi:DNA-binding LacI/PurR family transcriptional regulator
MTDMRQLADFLKISVGTVSRALNNKPDINPATKKRVLEAAEKLGYVPNQSGRKLRNGKSNSVALILDTCTSSSLEKNDLILLMAASIQSVFHAHGLDLLIFPRPDGTHREQFIRDISRRQLVDGLIVVTVFRDGKVARSDFEPTQPIVRWTEGEPLENEKDLPKPVQFETLGKMLANLLVAKLERVFEQNIHAKDANVVHFEKNLRINTADVDIRMEGPFHY